MNDNKKLKIPSLTILANLIIGAFTVSIQAILHVRLLLFSLFVGMLIGFSVGWILDHVRFILLRQGTTSLNQIWHIGSRLNREEKPQNPHFVVNYRPLRYVFTINRAFPLPACLRH